MKVMSVSMTGWLESNSDLSANKTVKLVSMTDWLANNLTMVMWVSNCCLCSSVN
jgi:hypothetical protein